MTLEPVFDHLVVVVHDLRGEMERWSGAGFEVSCGGVHTGGATENALIPLDPGGYLELLAPTPGNLGRRRALFTAERSSSIGERIRRHLAGEPGLLDFCVGVQDLDATVERLGEAGIPVHGPEPGGRERSDGMRIEWRTAVCDVAGLPFLIADVTPRQHRVPAAESAACTLERVRVASEDLESTAAAYEALCGPPVASGPGTAVFRIGSVKVELCRVCEGGLRAGLVSFAVSADTAIDASSLPSWIEVVSNPQ